MPTQKKHETCERCYCDIKRPYLTAFLDPLKDRVIMRHLCKDCWEITLHAASPDSWQQSTARYKKTYKLYYFDKQK